MVHLPNMIYIKEQSMLHNNYIKMILQYIMIQYNKDIKEIKNKF
jgi:hypothetical protein